MAWEREWRELGPLFVDRVELGNLARVPQRDPDVVVAVGNHAIWHGAAVRNRIHGDLVGGAFPLADRASHDPADVEIALGVERHRLHPLHLVSDDVVWIT